MKLIFSFSTIVALVLSLVLREVCGRPSVHVITRVCDSRQFLKLYQRTCTFYGKRNRQSSIRWSRGQVRIARGISNDLEDLEPAPELARKCCQEGCSVELIGLHCNKIRR